MTYFIATRDGYLSQLIESEQIARDLRVSSTQPDAAIRVVQEEGLADV